VGREGVVIGEGELNKEDGNVRGKGNEYVCMDFLCAGDFFGREC